MFSSIISSILYCCCFILSSIALHSPRDLDSTALQSSEFYSIIVVKSIFFGLFNSSLLLFSTSLQFYSSQVIWSIFCCSILISSARNTLHLFLDCSFLFYCTAVILLHSILFSSGLFYSALLFSPCMLD